MMSLFTSRLLKGLALAVVLIAGSSHVRAADSLAITGAGATFPYPLYSKWFFEYQKTHPEVKFNYQSIGSGGGIKQILAKTVDFGASDAPMDDKELAASPEKLVHVPTVLGAVVLGYNLPEVPSGLKLTGTLVADIFMGKVKKWNDPAIKAENPSAALPDRDILVVHRSDGSGTTYVFTDYLSKVSEAWKTTLGTGKAVTGLQALVAKAMKA